MLPLVLVLLFANNALSLPAVNVNFYEISQSPVVPDNGRLINSNVTTSVYELVDEADTSLYVKILSPTIHDLADLGDAASQASAAVEIIVVIGELANGIPGDSCDSAALINAAVGNRGALRAALARFIERILGYIDAIVGLALDPNDLRYSAGIRRNCFGSGRIYQFEKAWNLILSKSNDFNFPLLNEQYCAAKRLYTAFDIRSNNVAAAITAANIPEVGQVARLALIELGEFLRSVAAGINPIPTAKAAKVALLEALAEID